MANVCCAPGGTWYPSCWLALFVAVVHSRFQNQTQNLTIKRIHGADYMYVLFWIALGWLDVWFFGALSAFSLYCQLIKTCFKRINRVCRFVGFLWNLAKINVHWLSMCKSVRLYFLIFQIHVLFLLHSLMRQRSANIHFANFKIHFLGNQSEYQKSLTCL